MSVFPWQARQLFGVFHFASALHPLCSCFSDYRLGKVQISYWPLRGEDRCRWWLLHPGAQGPDSWIQEYFRAREDGGFDLVVPGDVSQMNDEGEVPCEYSLASNPNPDLLHCTSYISLFLFSQTR